MSSSALSGGGQKLRMIRNVGQAKDQQHKNNVRAWETPMFYLYKEQEALRSAWE